MKIVDMPLYSITLDYGGDRLSKSTAHFNKQKVILNTSCLIPIPTKGTAQYNRLVWGSLLSLYKSEYYWKETTVREQNSDFIQTVGHSSGNFTDTVFSLFYVSPQGGPSLSSP